MPTCELPDTMTSLPLSTFEFSPAAGAEVAALASGPPEAIFLRLLRDQESEVTLLLARLILAAFLPQDPAAAPATGVADAVASARESLLPSVRALARLPDPEAHAAALRQRAPLAILAGCWLDTISQPATQPAIVVNRLFSHYFAIKGEGDTQRSLSDLRRRTLAASGILLPDVTAADFLRKASAHPLTVLHCSFYLALSRLPASFLPEVAGVHYAFHALGVDDLLLGEPPLLSEPALRTALDEYLELADDACQARLAAAADLVIRLEREHVALLEALTACAADQSLDARVAEIIRRHAPYAGPQHRRGPAALRAADEHTAAWRDRIAHADPGDVAFAAPSTWTDRELLHRLVNIEHFASTLPLAKRRARDCLQQAEILFEHGFRGRFTDATYFDYSSESFISRLDQIYWDKMGECRALGEIPGRDEVVFGQKLSALGNLIDGAWAHRIGNLGRFDRPSDGLLFGIYADEMGRGDLRKNHITVIHQVLCSLGLELPHIRDAKFLEQDELLDELYGYTLYQLCLALFPDSFYNEILGYNLGIEMFGLGEVRLHEMQRLRHHGFDDSYERLHLSIDNFSAGHARQSADIIMAYLDGVERHSGQTAVPAEWRRIWRGYASFAYFVEDKLVRSLGVSLVI